MINFQLIDFKENWKWSLAKLVAWRSLFRILGKKRKNTICSEIEVTVD